MKPKRKRHMRMKTSTYNYLGTTDPTLDAAQTSRCTGTSIIEAAAGVGALPAARMVNGVYLKSHNLGHNYEAMAALHGAGSLNGRTRSWWQTRLNWIQESANYQGFQLSLPWGLYETGASGGGNFTHLNYAEKVVNELGAMGKYVILMPYQTREFRNGDVTSLSAAEQMRYLLPEDLRTKQSYVSGKDVLVSQGITVHATTGAPSNALGANGDYAHDAATNILYGPKAGGVYPAGVDLDTNDVRGHWLWDYAYSYTKQTNGAMGFDLKMYKDTLRNRHARFLQAVAAKFNNNPFVLGITTVESPAGEPAYLGNLAGGIVADGCDAVSDIVDSPNNYGRKVLSGKLMHIQNTRWLFPNKWFAQDINLPLNSINFVKEYFDQAQTYKMGATSSDTVWYSAPLVDPTEPTVGCLVRMSQNVDTMPVMAQCQQYCWESNFNGAPAINSTADYNTRFEHVWSMVRGGNSTNGLGINAHMVLIQIETAQSIWRGGSYNGVTVPSLNTWLKNKFAAEGITDGSAGLNTTQPSYIGMTGY